MTVSRYRKLKNLVLHVSLPINEYTVLMASDVIDQFCTPNSVFTQGNNHYIAINLEKDEQEKAKQLFDALSVNGKIEMPLEKRSGALYMVLLLINLVSNGWLTAS